MDLNFLNNALVPVIVGICLCVGYVIKASVPKVPNNLIPLIMLILGLIINISINKTVSADIILGGMFSGLASTGMYEMFRNLINKGDK